MPSPLLFNIFFAAVIDIIFQWFTKEPSTMTNVVHLNKAPTLVGLETAMEKVVRPVWGMPYGDDACTT